MTDINLKTLTPDTSLPTTGFLFGADSQASTNPSVYSTQTVATTLLGSTSLTGDTLTASAPVLNLTQTWSNISTVFTGVKLNVTNSNSASGSLLMDLQVGGSSKFSVDKTGLTTVSGDLLGNYIYSKSGAYTLSGFAPSANGFIFTGANGRIGFCSTFDFQGTIDTILSRKGAANLQLGAADAAAPVAQTLSVQSVVAGTSSTAGADFTLTGSQNTGSGLAGNLIVSTGFSNTVGTATVTITIATPGVITWTAHGLVTGSPVVFTTTGALPTGITAGTTYFAITSSTLGVNTFQIATSAANAAAGTAVATSGTQSGVQTGTTSATVQSPLMTTTTFGPSGLTGSQATSLLNLTQNWNTSGNPTALKLNVTNAASGGSALLMDLQVGGSSKFNVDKGGNLSSGVINLLNGSDTTIQINPSQKGIALTLNGVIKWQSSTTSLSGVDYGVLGISSNSTASNAIFRFGYPDAAAPVAQTLSVQSVVATTSNTAGADFKITGSQGTGNAAGGSIIFQVAPAGGSGTAQNALQTALTLTSSNDLTLGASGNGQFPVFRLLGTDGRTVFMSARNVGGNGGVLGIYASTQNAFIQLATESSFSTSVMFGIDGASNTLAQRNGVNAQTFRAYNTYTDGSNYERGVFDWTTTANTLTIGTEKAGSGSTRNLQFVIAGVNKLDYGVTNSNYWTTPTGIYVQGSLTAGSLVYGSGLASEHSLGLRSSTGLVSGAAAVSIGVNTASSGTATYAIAGTKGNASSTVVWSISSDGTIWQVGGTTSSYPALKRSTTSLQARLADDSAFTNIQGKLTTDTAYTAGTVVPTGYITIYDSTGTAYRVPCLV